MPNIFKNGYCALYLLGFVLIEIQLMVLQLEFKFAPQAIIPIFDAIILLVIGYLLWKKKFKHLIFPLLLLVLPLLVLIYDLKAYILSEVYFWGHLVKTLFVLLLINSVIINKEKNNGVNNRLLLIFFLLLLIIPNAFFVLVDFSSPPIDPARHMKNGFEVFNLITGKGLYAGFMFYDLYPSLSYILCAPFIILFGKTYDSMILSVLLFWLPLSFIYTKKIINEIFKVKEGYAIMLSFIYHSNFLFLSLYKQFLLDFQPVALLPLYYYSIWRSCFFASRKFSVVSGLILGIGFLCKQSFILYVAPLLIFSIGRLVWYTWSNQRKGHIYYIRRCANFFIHIITGLAIIIPWFGGWQFMYEYEMDQVAQVVKMEGDPDPLTLDSLLWYFPQFLYSYTWPIIVLLLLGWYIIIKNHKFRIHKYMAGFSILFIFIILTLNYNKDLRYIIGIFFFMGFGFFGLAYLKEKYVKFLLSLTVLIHIFYSIQLVAWDKFFIPTITISNYALLNSPRSPALTTEAEAIAVFEKLFSEQHIPEPQKVLSYNFYKNDSNLNQFILMAQRSRLGIKPNVQYDSLFNPGVKMDTELFTADFAVIHGQNPDSGSHYLFARSSFYPSYFLLKFRKAGNMGLITQEGFEGAINGVINVIADAMKGDSVIGSESGWILSNRYKFKIPPDADKFRIRLILHHSGGRWQLIFLNKLTPYFANNYIAGPLIPYSKDIDENKNWIIVLK